MSTDAKNTILGARCNQAPQARGRRGGTATRRMEAKGSGGAACEEAPRRCKRIFTLKTDEA
eukprot:7742048-Pyramimonas_sp.AAC.1